MKQAAAEILREYGPFPGVDRVNGVTFDGQHVWFASGDKLNAFDPASGEAVRSIDVAAHAGTAFDGQHLFQLAEDRIQKIDPKTGKCALHDPGARRRRARGSRGPKERSGWGSIGIGRSIKSIPKPGRFFAPSSPTASSPGSPGSTANSGTPPGKVTRAICGGSILEPAEVLEKLEMPPGVAVSGLESDGGDQFFCGGGSSGKVRAVRRPKRK